jgi:hypothetical protein
MQRVYEYMKHISVKCQLYRMQFCFLKTLLPNICHSVAHALIEGCSLMIIQKVTDFFTYAQL